MGGIRNLPIVAKCDPTIPIIATMGKEMRLRRKLDKKSKDTKFNKEGEIKKRIISGKIAITTAKIANIPPKKINDLQTNISLCSRSIFFKAGVRAALKPPIKKSPTIKSGKVRMTTAASVALLTPKFAATKISLIKPNSLPIKIRLDKPKMTPRNERAANEIFLDLKRFITKHPNLHRLL